MLQKFYTVYDRHVGYGFPFAQPNDACACRTFKIWLNDPQSELSKSPDDYELFYLGEYETETGKALFEPKAIVKGGDEFASKV